MSTPRVSLILLCYNHENFIVEAIDGVLAQTYGETEIVIIDDGSSDRTPERIIARLAEHPRGGRARFEPNHQNIGGRASIERGLALTTGEFVFIMSGDDIPLPEMVSEMVGAWQRDNVSLVAANAIYIDAHSRPLGRTYRDPDAIPDESFETLARDGANDCCFGPAMGFERAVYDEFGWPPQYLGAFDLMLPFYAHLQKGVRFVQAPLIQYRVHPGNTSLSLQQAAARDIDRLLAEEQDFYLHMAHAFFMEAELDRQNEANPSRFGEIARAIKPLLMIKAVEMGRKLVRTRLALYTAGVTHLRAGPSVGAR